VFVPLVANEMTKHISNKSPPQDMIYMTKKTPTFLLQKPGIPIHYIKCINLSGENYTLGLKGMEHLRAKLIINNQIIEQVNSFNYLRSTTFYLQMKDVVFKLHKFQKLLGTIR
jgi:hypothetical protein